MLLLLALACDPSTKEAGDTAAVDADTHDSSATSDAPTYWRDVRPLLDLHCARCHTDGGQAPSFDDASVVQAKAALLSAYVESGRMPPPAPDPACRDYQDAGRFVLSDDERAVLSAWANAEAPLGDEASYVAPPGQVSIAPYDLTLYGDVAYTPTFPEDGASRDNDYRCFALDFNNDTAWYVTGFEALVDNLSIVHHVVLFNPNGRALQDDDGDLTNGFPCGGFGEDGWDFVTGWAPGSGAVKFPDGLGMAFDPNTQLVLQMHYYRSFEGAEFEEDHSGYGITYSTEPLWPVYQVPVGTYGFTIPAGESDYVSREHLSWDAGYPDVEVLGVWPHMHVLGTGFEAKISHADGSETCLVDLNGWDFHNQIGAYYLDPPRVTEGDRITMACHWDNSSANPNQPNDPPQDVYWGEGTQEEMCFGFTYATLAR